MESTEGWARCICRGAQGGGGMVQCKMRKPGMECQPQGWGGQWDGAGDMSQHSPLLKPKQAKEHLRQEGATVLWMWFVPRGACAGSFEYRVTIMRRWSLVDGDCVRRVFFCQGLLLSPRGESNVCWDWDDSCRNGLLQSKFISFAPVPSAHACLATILWHSLGAHTSH